MIWLAVVDMKIQEDDKIVYYKRGVWFEKKPNLYDERVTQSIRTQASLKAFWLWQVEYAKALKSWLLFMVRRLV